MKKRIAFLLVIFILLTVFSSCSQLKSIVRHVINVRKYEKPFTFINVMPDKKSMSSSSAMHITSSPYGHLATPPTPPPMPWDNSLALTGKVDSGIVENGRDIELKFTLNANDHVLSGGDLHLVFEMKDFVLKKDGEEIENNTYVIKDFFDEGKSADSESLTLALSPDFEDGLAIGDVDLWIRFVPDDMDEFMERMIEKDQYVVFESEQILEDGFLSLGSGAISYCVDSVETWLKNGTSFGNVFYDMSRYHYDKGLISAEEMARLCYGYRYLNSVQTFVCDYNKDDHTMAIGYYSKNIRYESSDKLSDSALEEALLAHEEFWHTNHYQPAKGGLDATLRILEIMKDRGVITDEEYERELLLLDEVLGVYTGFTSRFPGGESGYEEIDALHLTHNDK